MNNDGAAIALIPAAGIGSRLGLDSKAFLSISGLTLLERAVASVSKVAGRVLVGVAAEDVARARLLLFGSAEVYTGGETRAETIALLLNESAEPYVLVHDAARPFASATLVSKVLDAARLSGAAVSVSRPSSSVMNVEGGLVRDVWPRSAAAQGQTPFCLRREILLRALDLAQQSGEDRSPWEFVVELGLPVTAVPGEESNIKITTPLDWQIATQVIARTLASD